MSEVKISRIEQNPQKPQNFYPLKLIRYTVFGFLLLLISVQCYYSVGNAFQSAFSSIVYFKVCFEMCKIRL